MRGIFSWLRRIQVLRLASQQLLYVDELERVVQYMKPREHQPGTAERILEMSLPFLSHASTREELQEAYSLTFQKLLHIPHDEYYIDRENVDRKVSI